MKKTLYIAAIAALFTLSSCQKGEVANKDNYTGEDPVFTATIASDATRTLIDQGTGIVTWNGHEEIDITDASGKTVEYKVSAVSKDSRTATITKKDTETKTLGDGPYKAVYGSSLSTSIYYDTVAPLYDLPMEATSETTNLEFKITCGALEVRLKKAGTTITKIEVSNATDTYTLDCSNGGGVSIGDTAKFYITLPEGEYTKFVFTTSDGKTCIKQNNASGVKLLANQIRPITFTNMLFFPADAIHGLFSVDEDGTKVCFAKGNLYYDGSAFKFEDNQLDYPTSWNTSHVGHFYWSKDASNAYAEEFNQEEERQEDDVFFTNATETTPNSTFTVKSQQGLWRTLSSGEWEYLLARKDASSKYKYGYAIVQEKKGIIILPDTFIDPKKNDGSKSFVPGNDYYSSYQDNKYTISNWAAMESVGAVFLPAAGYRDGNEEPTTIKDYNDFGFYGSSSTSDENEAFYLNFANGSIHASNPYNRSHSIAVRLVSDIQKAPDVTFDGGTIKDMTRDNDNVLDW